MKITDIEVTALRVPGWDAKSFDGSYDNCIVAGSHRRRHHRACRGRQRPGGDPRNRRGAVLARPCPRTEGRARRPRSLRRRGALGASCTTRPAITAGAASSSMRSARSTSRSGTFAARRPASLSSRCSAGEQRDRVKAYGTIYPLGSTPDEVRSEHRPRPRPWTAGRSRSWPSRAGATISPRAETLIRAARDHVGPDIDLMIDAAAAWEMPEHGLPLMPVFRDCGFLWVEAPLPLDDVAGHAQFPGFWRADRRRRSRRDDALRLRSAVRSGTDRHRAAGCDHGGRPDGAQTHRGDGAAGGASASCRTATRATSPSPATSPSSASFGGEEMLEYSTSRSPLRWELTREKFEIGRRRQGARADCAWAGRDPRSGGG